MYSFLFSVFLNCLTVFGVRCSDYYVISIFCDLYVFWGKWNFRGVNVENVGYKTSPCGTPVLIHLSFENVPLY